VAGDKELAGRIRELMAAGVQASSQEARDVAEQYAQRCAEVNDILRQCAAYLDHSMRTEAIHLAETAPPVLEAAAALDFPGVEAWREACRRAGAATPAAIAADIVARLNRAYMEEESLSSLLARYRSVARRGPLTQRISLLRRVARMDPENANWKQDLAALERARLKELAADAPRVIEGTDMEALTLLARELGSEEWLERPDPALLARVENRIREMRDAEARRKAEALAAEAWAAYGALDLDRVGSALRRWQGLAERERVAPPAAAAQIDEVRAWHDAQLAKLDDERAFAEAQRRLAAALDRGARRAELERLAYEVNRFRRDLPEDLRRRAQRALDNASLSEAREFRLKVIGVVILALAVAGPVVAVLAAKLSALERQRWERQVEEAVKAADFEKAAKLLAEMARQKPDLLREPEFQERAARLEQERAAAARNRETFSGVMAQLRAVREAGFPPDAASDRLEEMAARTAAAESEKLQLEEWRIAKRTAEAERREKADQAFSERLEGVIQALSRVNAMEPGADPKAYEAALNAATQLAEAARGVSGVSAALLKSLAQVETQLKDAAQRLAQARKRNAERDDLLARMAAAPPDLVLCERLGREFLERFSDDAEAGRVRRIVKDCALGRDLERGLKWKAAPEGGMEEEAKAFLAGEESRTSLWRGPLERVAAMGASARKAPEALAALAKLRDAWPPAKGFSFSATDRRTGEKRRYYFQQPFQTQAGRDGAETFNVYGVQVIGKGHEAKLKWFSARDYEMDLKPDLEDNLAPQARFVQRLLERAGAVKPWDLEVELLAEAEALRSGTDVDPVVKAFLIRTLLENVKALTFENGALADQALKQIADANTNVFWMDPEPDAATTAARRKIERILESLSGVPTMAAVSRLRQRMHEEVFARKAKCVGAVGGGGLEFRGARPVEAWILETDAKGVARPRIVMTDGGAAAGVEKLLYAGQPVFAPSDGRLSPEVAAGLAQGMAADALRLGESVSWPEIWPLEARVLKPGGGR